MSQKTNLNVSPYFDDFDKSKDFYKVLFKPGVPVQSRELTTLQSILQNQVETFGTHVFKEGSMVIPGGITYNNDYKAVKLNNTQFGVDISIYIDKFVGKTIVGQTTGIRAKVKQVVLPTESDEVEYITLYVNYIDSGNNFEFASFDDGELISSTENVVYGNTTINSGTSFASLITENSTDVGSSVSISSGVYFIRGNFATVSDQTIILDYYSNIPRYRVGLTIEETIVDSKEDSSLFDNAKGFSNYASPGADRLKINLVLSKKPIDDFNDTNFVELLKVSDGELKKITTKTDYNIIKDYIAEKTFEESGNYSVNPFTIEFKNSLNDRTGSDGLFFDNELTEEGNVPSDNLGCLQISRGKAYVKGYPVEKTGTTILDVEKPRDTKEVKNLSVPFEMGNVLKVNKVTTVAKVKETIKLYSQFDCAGSQIGEARVYTFSLTDSPYLNDTTSWDLRLYDIQSYTKITLNQSVNSDIVKESFYVTGRSSGASGFATADGSSTVVYLRQTSGTFIRGEQLTINGLDISRSIVEVQVFNTQSIKSVKQNAPFGGSDFTANCILEKINLPSGIVQVSISAKSNGISTISSSLKSFTGITTDTIIRYQIPGLNLESFNRVNSISSDGESIEVVGITTASGVFDGGLPSSDILTNAFIGAPFIRGEGKLYAELPEKNISNIDVSTSNIIITEQISKSTDNNGVLTINTSDLAIQNASWTNFDQERYSIGYASNGIGTISNDTFRLSGNTLVISGLTPSQSVTLNATATKNGIISKIKSNTRSAIISVNKSKFKESGTTSNTSLNDGLTYSAYYGLRIQDREISLNYSDVNKVLAVYESLNESNPTLDQVQFNSRANVSSNAVIGENIVGRTSKAVARVVTNSTTSPSSSANELGVIYLTQNKLNIGEVVDFQETNIQTEVESITFGNYKNVTSLFSLDKGQNDQYYGYSKLIKNRGSFTPSRRLLIIFDHYSVSSTDNGDVFTVNSYDAERFTNDIPNIGKKLVRASDTLDFRPRVNVFDPAVTTDKSPFDFNARTSAFDTLPTRLLAPDEGSNVDVSFYLPRIDKIYLSKLGKFFIQKGTASINPREPERLNKDEFLELGTLNLSAYFYGIEDVEVSLLDNRRYTMRDIGNIDQRIGNLEKYTTLSLLELNAQSFQIQDFEGRSRFKSGFFVDDFSDSTRIDLIRSNIQVNDEIRELEPFRQRNSLQPLIASKESKTPEELDLNVDFELLDNNVQKTGNVVTLKYEEVGWLEQPFATIVENVNPFSVVAYEGIVELTPERDVYVRTIQLPDNIIRVTRNRTNVSWSGARASVTTTTVGTNIRNNLISVSDDMFMRSRNTEFRASNLKPYTRYYQFIDGNSGFDFIPKLIEVADTELLDSYGSSGGFSVGETVIGTVDGIERIRFRVATPNHKFGAFDSPTTLYTSNPYLRTEEIGNFYSSNSKILNIDTSSLAREAQGRYHGYLEKGMQLVGQTSGSIAYVKDLRLISDSFGDLIGSYFLRDPNTTPPPANRLEVGEKTFMLNSSSSNQERVRGSTVISTAEFSFISEGVVETYQRNVTITTTNTTTIFLNPPPPPPPPPAPPRRNWRGDPLAQTFTVGGDIDAPTTIKVDEDVNGAFITSVDLFFNTIDEGNAPLRVEMRTVELGTPTLNVIGRPAIVRPRSTDSQGNLITNINISSTAALSTNIKFPEPIYLESNNEYALVIVSEFSNDYELWTAVMGEDTIETANLPDTGTVRFTQQFALGSLFKSQNGSIWTTNQYQDLKFKLYKANFTAQSGTAYFYNPPLDSSNGFVPKLQNDSLRILPKTGKIGVTTITDSTTLGILTTGRRLAGVNGNNGSAVITGTGSSVSTVGISTGGENYPISLSGKSVGTFNIVGRGSGLKLLINTNNVGIVTGVGIDTGQWGSGYQVGDLVGINTSDTSSNNPTGRNSEFTITSITGANVIYLTNVQGEFGGSGLGKEFSVGAALSYYSGSTGNTIVSLAGTTITSSTSDGGVYSGNKIKVMHFNHGMYSPNNKLKLYDASSDIPPTSLTSVLISTSLDKIRVSNTSNFNTFEGQPVSGSYPGYVKIGQEIIEYNFDGTGAGELNIVSRNIDSTKAITHSLNSLVYKYELGGVSLRRINNVVRNISSTEEIDLDSYYIEIDRGNTDGYGIQRSADGNSSAPQLSFNTENNVGGSEIRASQNILFNSMTPWFDIVTPNLTSTNASVRTITGTSVDGNEVSFNDKGYESIELNNGNSFSDVRMISSEENQDAYLTSLPRSKSITTGISFNTENVNISPILFLDNSFIEFTNSRLNNPIANYSSDSRVNSIFDDPHAAIYYSNTIQLRNPASLLKVIVSAYRSELSDFRVLYNLTRQDSSEISQSYELFPGYDNLISTSTGFKVIDSSKNSGLSDVRVPASSNNEFIDYEFTAENLDLFTGFSIKIVMSGKNQAEPPRFKDLRVIATR